MRRRTITVTVLGAVLAGALGAWWLASRDARASLLRPDDAGLVARGAEVYAAQCAACHGASLEGQPAWRRRREDGRLPAPPHDETGHTWHHPDRVLFRITKHGPAALAGGGYVSDMPGYEGVLDDADIVAVLSYIKSTWPARVREQHDRINARAGSG